ncbi:MAG: hypothetical protein WA139_02110 [Candidatus Aenigmatarchaeota archaeon]
MKAISAVIATVMLLMITVSLVGVFYVFSSTLATQTTGAGGQQASQLTAQLSMCMQIRNTYGNQVTLENCGTGIITNDSIAVFVDENRIWHNMSAIEAGKSGEVNLTENIVGEKITIKLGATSASADVKGAIISESKNENEHFSNGGICSKDLYILENSEIRFFAPVPRTYAPVTVNDCNSGVSSYNDIYGASPMRIWAKRTDAASYRKHESVIDDTIFYAAGFATFSFPNKPSFSDYGKTEQSIAYKGSIVSNMEPTLEYSILPKKNYVKVSLSVRNNGASSQNVRLVWEGDQDGAGVKHFQSGYENSSGGPYQVNMGERWLAEWLVGKNDVIGYIAPSGGEVEIYSIYEPIHVEEKTAASVGPGQMHSFVFFIVADKKGPAGNEWKPVQDAFNEVASY